MEVNSELRVFRKPRATCALWRKLKTTVFLVRKSEGDMSEKFQRIRSPLNQNGFPI
jgi:hypothetical protein